MARGALHFGCGPELLAEPHGHRHEEGARPARRDGQVRLEDARELAHRLVVEAHVIEAARLDARLSQAELDRAVWERRVVTLAREPLLLRRRDDDPVTHEARCAVMVVGGEAEDVDGHRLREAFEVGRLERPALSLNPVGRSLEIATQSKDVLPE